MAKKPRKTTKKRRTKSGVLLNHTVEIKVPSGLFDIVDHLRKDDAHREFLNQTIRAVFDQHEMFDIVFMLLRESKLTKADLAEIKKTGRDPDGGHIKVCEGA